MTVGTGGSWMVQNMAKMFKAGMRMAPPPSPPPTPGAQPAPQKMGNKDTWLAMEMADAVGAKVPVARFMDELDMAVYDAYSDAMSGRNA